MIDNRFALPICGRPLPRECSWPMKSSLDPDWWCGKQTVDGLPYCEKHSTMVTMLNPVTMKAAVTKQGCALRPIWSGERR